VNIQNVLTWLKLGMETPAPLLNDVVNNVVFHSSAHISQTLLQIIHILHICLQTRCNLVRSQLDCGQGCLVATYLEFHRVTTIS